MYKEAKGIKIPAIGFGTYRIQDASVISSAIKAGYKHIDTARSYDNEEMVGNAWKNSGIHRHDLFITTKIWHDRLKPEQVKKDIDDSLKKLQTEYVDLLLIHWPSTENVPLEETLQAFQEVQRSGKTKIFGVSNFTANMLQEANNIAEIHCNQVEYHPFLNQKQLLSLCEKEGILLTAYRPIAKNAVAEANVLKELSAKYKKSPAQITLRWLIQQKPVLAIPRSSQVEHIKANLQVFDFELTEEEMASIHQLDENDRQVDPAFAPNWEMNEE
jgi:2,5-diketo-D-gluconate reductase B